MVSLTYLDPRYGERLVWLMAEEFLIDAEGTISAELDGRRQAVAYFSHDGELYSADLRDPAREPRPIPGHLLETCYEDAAPDVLRGVQVLCGEREIHLKGGAAVKLRPAREDIVTLRNERGSDLTATSRGSWPGLCDFLVVRPRHSELRLAAVRPGNLSRPSALAERSASPALAERSALSASAGRQAGRR